jgi:predicted branched-subunit amino acid permease
MPGATAGNANARDLISAGLRDAIPLFVPAIPFALVLGIAILSSGINPWLAWSTSPIVYGGAAQLTLISLLGEGASVAAAVTAALVVNARHLMYSAALAPAFQQQPRWFRWFGPYLLIDQAFALGILRGRDDPRSFRVYYLTIGLTFWTLWQLTTALALFIGPVIPVQWGLDFAVPILFLGLLVIMIDRWPKAAVAVLAAFITWLCAGLPNRSGLLVGALCGVAFGILLEKSRR